MSETNGTGLLALAPRRYRWVDRTTKLLGVGLIAAGLNAGGGTTTGIVLAVLGVAFGLSTIIIDKQ